MSLIEIKGLTKRYHLTSGTFKIALDDVSFEVKNREILGVIGKSGSGKSTLLRIIRGIEPFDRGHIRIGDVRLTPDSPKYEFEKVKSKSAYQYQRSFSLWGLTTVENIMKRLYALKTGDETLDLPPEDSKEYEELKGESIRYLRIVGLDHKWYQSAHTLSGGEKQRLVLARQLVLNPEILLLDEPLSMASPDKRVDIIELIRNLRNEHDMAVIMVSHLPEIHEKLSDRLVLLDDGRISFDGNVSEGIDLFLSELEPPLTLKPLKKKEPAFIVENVKKKYFHYNLKQLFELGVEKLEVFRGEILGIIGPSGSGKTVLVRLLSGLELPNEGRITFIGKEFTAIISELGLLNALARQRIGLVRQEFDLTYYASILDIILSKKRLATLTEDDIKKIIEDFDLTDKSVDFLLRLAHLPPEIQRDIVYQIGLNEDELADFFLSLPYVPVDHKDVKSLFYQLELPADILERRAFELSGGEKIRVAIGVEMAMNPDILILDEPFADLDPITTRMLCNVLKTLNNKLGITMLIVSHNRTALKEIAHRIVKVEDGTLLGEVEDETELENLLKTKAK
jgi:methyl coenzyme M reductase system subunit A2